MRAHSDVACVIFRPGFQLGDLREPAGEDYTRAVSVLLPYLLSHRTRLAASLPAAGSDGASPGSVAEPHAAPAQHRDGGEEAGVSGADVRGVEARLRDGAAGAEVLGLSAEQRVQLAEAVDTAILKVVFPHLSTFAQATACTITQPATWPVVPVCFVSNMQCVEAVLCAFSLCFWCQAVVPLVHGRHQRLLERGPDGQVSYPDMTTSK